MNNNRKALSRRTMLRAAGVTMALPFLDKMRATGTILRAAESVASPVRLAWVFFPNGTNAKQWLPAGSGKDWELTDSLTPLAAHKKNLSVYRGLAQNNASSLGDGPGDHARSASAFLTGAHPFKTAGSGIRVGRSIDQVAADVYGRDTRLSSIELGTESGRAAGACDSGYSCAYSNNISWRTESQPMSKEVSPRLAFERLFGGTAKTPSEKSKNDSLAAERLQMRKSILDSLASETQSLNKSLGLADRQKMDQYLSSVRDIERRIETLQTPVDLSGLDVTVPDGKPEDTTQHIRLMYDLMALAFRTDTTRIATFMLGNEGSGRSFPMIDVNEGHHELSHHQDQKEKMDAIARIDRYYAEQFGYFLSQLEETPDGDGSLLDNSLIVYGGAISDGNRHNHNDLPILMAGKGGNRVETGRLVQCDGETPLNNLFLSMLDVCDVSVDEFGDSTGKLSL